MSIFNLCFDVVLFCVVIGALAWGEA